MLSKEAITEHDCKNEKDDLLTVKEDVELEKDKNGSDINEKDRHINVQESRVR